MRSVPIVMFLALLVIGNQQRELPPREHHREQVEVVRVIDGDTYVVRRVQLIKVRLANGDMWESRKVRRAGEKPITDEEIVQGKIATQDAVGLLVGKRVWLDHSNEIELNRLNAKVGIWDDEEGRLGDVGTLMGEGGHDWVIN